MHDYILSGCFSDKKIVLTRNHFGKYENSVFIRFSSADSAESALHRYRNDINSMHNMRSAYADFSYSNDIRRVSDAEVIERLANTLSRGEANIVDHQATLERDNRLVAYLVNINFWRLQTVPPR